MLYCTSCRRGVLAGRVVCDYCRTGFVPRLACAECNFVVSQGKDSCPRCGPNSPEDPVLAIAIVPLNSSIPAVAGLPRGMAMPARISDSYTAGKFGAEAKVTLNGQDASIMTEMGQVAALLHVLAGRMNELQGHMASTRQCIRDCRKLAADLQEEVEVRIGPK